MAKITAADILAADLAWAKLTFREKQGYGDYSGYWSALSEAEAAFVADYINGALS